MGAGQVAKCIELKMSVTFEIAAKHWYLYRNKNVTVLDSLTIDSR